MVNINRVYQKVLTLTNKEQRGYITPQEFNLLANQAQMEIFEQYFYDIEQWERTPGSENEYSDMVTNIENKIAKFQVGDYQLGVSNVNGYLDLSQGDIYKLGSIIATYSSQGVNNMPSIAEKLTIAEFNLYEQSSFTRGTYKRPYYVLQEYNFGALGAKFSPPLAVGDKAIISYIRPPINAQWGYVVVQGKALFDPNPNKTQNFELHLSEEVELVYKILKLAGVTIKNVDVVQIGQGMEAAQIKQEKQ